MEMIGTKNRNTQIPELLVWMEQLRIIIIIATKFQIDYINFNWWNIYVASINWFAHIWYGEWAWAHEKSIEIHLPNADLLFLDKFFIWKKRSHIKFDLR